MKITVRSALALAWAVVVGVAVGVAIAWLTQSNGTSSVDRLKAEAGVQVGDSRPAFAHAGVNGELWRASDFDGRPTLVNFWATWCVPCLREMPLLQSMAEKYPERLNVVGIAVDEPGEVASFVERLGITYPILIGTSDVRETQRRYGNPGGMLPYSVLVDADGTIRWRHLGELDETALQRALQPVLEVSGR